MKAQNDSTLRSILKLPLMDSLYHEIHKLLSKGPLVEHTMKLMVMVIPSIRAIDQSKLVPLLTATLKEAITKIESLELELVN